MYKRLAAGLTGLVTRAPEITLLDVRIRLLGPSSVVRSAALAPRGRRRLDALRGRRDGLVRNDGSRAAGRGEGVKTAWPGAGGGKRLAGKGEEWPVARTRPRAASRDIQAADTSVALDLCRNLEHPDGRALRVVPFPVDALRRRDVAASATTSERTA